MTMAKIIGTISSIIGLNISHIFLFPFFLIFFIYKGDLKLFNYLEVRKLN